jgi:hypothetical protein
MVDESSAVHFVAQTTRLGVPDTGSARSLLDVAAVADDESTVLRALNKLRRLHLARWPQLWDALILDARSGRNGIVPARQAVFTRTASAIPTPSSPGCSCGSPTRPAYLSQSVSTTSR